MRAVSGRISVCDAFECDRSNTLCLPVSSIFDIRRGMNETDGPVFVLRPSVSLNFCGACPFHVLAAGGGGQRARNRVEHGAEAVAHGRQSADSGHRNQGRDKAILNGGRTVLVFHERDHLPDHSIHSIGVLGRSDRASSQGGFNG